MTSNVVRFHNDRDEALKSVREMMLMAGVAGTTYVCRGLPVCAFAGIGRSDDSISDELSHCQYCTRIALTIDGVLTEVTPDGPN
jgi:hypothetical protein